MNARYWPCVSVERSVDDSIDISTSHDRWSEGDHHERTVPHHAGDRDHTGRGTSHRSSPTPSPKGSALASAGGKALSGGLIIPARQTPRACIRTRRSPAATVVHAAEASRA